MGTPGIPKPVRFFTSVISRDEERIRRVREELPDLLGDIEEMTAPVPFLHTHYYDREMGEGLLRCFLLFKPLAGRERLGLIKLRTNEIESRLSVDGRRAVNIDPGYISLEQVVLATTKGFTHRLYLGDGIFGDLTLIFSDGTFRPLPWTYPDYGGNELISLFNAWRNSYRALLRHGTGGGAGPDKAQTDRKVTACRKV
ncbi:DUF4416 family protein [Syntrophorhabdus aromaticivorans]|uniref:DUF4416 family protein n=1 Tax=Syntrophorhabdus aromaticivorans TaxID=328301 RepID=A0A351U0N5_9BACT|nr:DUF4416 family protein [Syntrophorhabdus aromaticivorans]NLW34725.1 DUF4416 family protein [Syntrophorhabdus aromaticivorans]HBA53516.1 DUF4416 domain-containing protein [Syntrophorhabdus aromaticivorans]